MSAQDKAIAQVVADREAQAVASVEDAERQRVRTAAEAWLQKWPDSEDANLPEGVQGNAVECVFAHALGGSWAGTWQLPEDRLAYKLGIHEVALPADVQQFIQRFDAGEYPDLIEDADSAAARLEGSE